MRFIYFFIFLHGLITEWQICGREKQQDISTSSLKIYSPQVSMKIQIQCIDFQLIFIFTCFWYCHFESSCRPSRVRGHGLRVLFRNLFYSMFRSGLCSYTVRNDSVETRLRQRQSLLQLVEVPIRVYVPIRTAKGKAPKLDREREGFTIFNTDIFDHH